MLTAEDAARAERVHREAYVIDAACPLVNPKEIGKQLDALRRGGVTCAVGTVASIEGSQETLHAIRGRLENGGNRRRDRHVRHEN